MIVGELEGDDKCKFQTGQLVFSGDWHAAMQFILPGQMRWVAQRARGAATNSGYSGAAISTGFYSTAETTATGTLAGVTGLNGKARAAERGCIALAWLNPATDEVEMRCALIGKGKGKLKANVWYQLNEIGEFTEV